MARKKKSEESGGSWLDTYADMVTLLLTFFVMLFSMSKVEEEKWQMLLEAFTSNGGETSQIVLAPEGTGNQMGTNQSENPLSSPNEESIESDNQLPDNFDELYEYLKAYVERHNMQSSVEVGEGEGSVFIRFNDNIFFDADSYDLKTHSQPVLDFLGNCLMSVETEIMTININGHTAAVPGNVNYHVSDRRLSGERASSVAIFFEDVKGIDPRKIIPIGYGKNFPVAPNDTHEGQQQNRRVDMVIVSDNANKSNDTIMAEYLDGTFDPTRYPDTGSSQDILLPEQAQSSSMESSAEESASSPPPVEPAAIPGAEGATPEAEGSTSSVAEALPQAPAAPDPAQ